MDCKKVIKQLSAYLDGQMTAAKREAVRSHLAGCARCRGELEALDRAAYAVADLPRLQAPSDLREKVMANLEGAAPEEARPPRWRMYWGAAAAIAFAIAIMYLTRPATAPRRTGPEAVAPAVTVAPGRQVAEVEKNESAGMKSAEEKALREAPVSAQAPTLQAASAAPGMHDEIVLPSAKPQVAASAAENASEKQVAQVERDQSAASKGADEKAAGAAPVSLQAPSLQAAPVLSEEIVLPSANPPAAYSSAVAVAAKGGWLPAELAKDGSTGQQLKSTAGQLARQQQLLQLTLRLKQSQVPLLKNALAGAGLQATEAKGGLVQEAPQTAGSAPQIAFAPPRAGLDNTNRSVTNAMSVESRFGLEERGTAANSATAAAAPPASRAMKVPAGAGLPGGRPGGSQGGTVAGDTLQAVSQAAAQQTAATTPMYAARKAEAAEEPVVNVTLLFPLAGVPVPAAPAATGAAKSATPE